MTHILERTIAIMDRRRWADVRVIYGTHYGEGRVDVRVFVGPEGDRSASGRGVCFKIQLLDELIAALNAARREAVREGRLPADESGAK